MAVERINCVGYSQAVRVRKDCLERVCGQWRDWNTPTWRRGIGRRYTPKKLFSRLCSEWEHGEPADEKLKDPIKTHWMEDDKVDKLEEEGNDEKEWWDKDGEKGYTSECDRVDWDWDDEVQAREIGYMGKKRV
jgi:hypothetical protein